MTVYYYNIASWYINKSVMGNNSECLNLNNLKLKPLIQLMQNKNIYCNVFFNHFSSSIFLLRF